MDSYVTSGNLSYKSCDITDKLNHTLKINTDIIIALKEHGCPDCLELLKNIIIKHGSSPNLLISKVDLEGF